MSFEQPVGEMQPRVLRRVLAQIALGLLNASLELWHDDGEGFDKAEKAVGKLRKMIDDDEVFG